MEFLTNEEIGKLIKEKREKLGMTQAQLGEKLGVGAGAVNKWELGTVVNVKREMLRNLAVVLKIHPANLIGIKVEVTEIVVDVNEFSINEINEIQNFIDYIKSKRGVI